MGLYGLPFEGIKEIRAEIQRIQAEFDAGMQGNASKLKKEFVDAFGYSLPIKLARMRTQAYSPLMWRDYTRGSNSRALLKGGFFGTVGRGILASLPEDKQRILMDIEFKRMHLSHVLGLLQYEIARLKRLESEFEAWRDRMRDVNQH